MIKSPLKIRTNNAGALIIPKQLLDNADIQEGDIWRVETVADTVKLTLEKRHISHEERLKAQVQFADKMKKVRAEVAREFGTNFTPSEEVIRQIREDDS